MEKKQTVPICENHLAELYQAVKVGDLSLIDKVEHELTEEEKCVACTYIFKTHGTVKEALEHFLVSDSTVWLLNVDTQTNAWAFWGLRMSILFVILGLNFLVAACFRAALFHEPFSVFPLGVLGFTMVCLASLVIFLFVDDIFFD